ncbi:DNA/RNA helicase domain-containing protein [Actinospica robiniae]|uniref:DNA/RNA helicase domain-containing protein n=1 Tax=Actinospica robiniae TaxID=304901 RepID=UPI00146FC178|nr:DNA/RNA helicase domain-containing protein [Actinospica robiniae]
MTQLAQDLQSYGLGHVQMFIEYDVDPALTGLDPAPIDVLLAGAHPKTGESSFVAVELKQWETVDRVDGDPTKVRVPQYKKAKLHPAVQVDNNRQRLIKHLELFSNRYVTISALAYLHNLNGAPNQWVTHYSPSPFSKVITGLTPDVLRENLLKHLSTTDVGNAAAKAAEQLANSRVLPPSPLQEVFGDILAGRRAFNLVDDQLTAFTEITAALERPTGAAQDVFLVKGRPGTGKSVIAVHLLRWAAAKGYQCRFVSGGTASRTTFQKNSPGYGKLFTTLNSLAGNHEPKSLDLIVVDEAHRLTQFPVINSAGTMREGEESIDIVLSRARIPVFFIDDDQRVRPNEIVSAQQIEEHARNIHSVSLSSRVLRRPMRGAGSLSYDTWVKRLLGRADPTPLHWAGEDPFGLVLAESPAQMEELLRARISEGRTARMAAGFCWKWSLSVQTAHW